MPNATELAINTAATALDLATTIFGNGVTVGTATLTGNVAASATYSGADATLGAIAPADEGIILSTGNAAGFTNSSGTLDTNISEATASTNHAGAGDTALGTATGQTTFDAVVLEATFKPDDDFITMLFIFSSEEYLEYVNGGVNDAFGVWVNGAYVPFNPVASGVASIDTINDVTSSNLYLDNDPTADTYNTEMDGSTLTLSINAPVNAGALNTIRIALADGGDGVYDSNVLIAADSVQTVAIAFDDDATIEANTATTIDVLDNDIDTTGLGLTITEINGVPVIVGQTVTLPTGEQVTLNADNTLTVLADGDLGSEPFTYTVVDSAGNTRVAFITLTTEADIPLNYIVEGTSSDELIDSTYTLDPQGDVIDGNNAADGSNDDMVEAGAGSGNDTVFGEAGNDLLFGFDGNDEITGGDGADIINGMTGNDLLDGGADNDTFVIEAAFGTDSIVGGEGTTTGTDDDLIRATSGSLTDPSTGTFTGNEAGTLANGTDTLTFSEIEAIELGAGDDTVDGTATTTGINVDTNDGADSILGGSGDDTVDAGAGNDSITGGQGSDSILAGDSDDTITVAQGDTVVGGDGDDTFTLVDLAEAGTDTITIIGGEGDETNGDTLDLNGIADRTTINITTPANVGGGISGTVELLDGTVVDFSNIENIICFTLGTMVATHAGLRKIEDLKVGDPVVTQDNGIQKIGWIGKTTVSARDNFAPVKFAKSVFPGATDDLIVSPQHRMLIKGYRAELLFGQSEVLMPAIYMIDGKDVTRLYQEDVTYIHIMFEQHEIIFANGIPAESFHPGAFGVDKLEDKAREELFALFPELRSDLNHYGPTARMALKAKEAKVLAEFA